MTIQELSERALEIRKQYEMFEKRKWGRAWATSDLALGFMGNLGDFVKLAQAKEGIRLSVDDLEVWTNKNLPPNKGAADDG